MTRGETDHLAVPCRCLDLEAMVITGRRLRYIAQQRWEVVVEHERRRRYRDGVRRPQ
ncbi:MAG: hypothetical protein WCA90_01750 [Ilumatobacteraceae bacterium]